MLPRPAGTASFGHLLKMQILRPRVTESETSGAAKICSSSSPPGDIDEC